VVQRGDTIQVNADLTKCATIPKSGASSMSAKLPTLFAAAANCRRHRDQLRSKLSGSEKQQVTKQGTQNPEAYQLYVKGRYYWGKRTNADIKTAISYFNQAIEKDPATRWRTRAWRCL